MIDQQLTEQTQTNNTTKADTLLKDFGQ